MIRQKNWWAWLLFIMQSNQLLPPLVCLIVFWHNCLSKKLFWYVYHNNLEMSTAEAKPKKLRCEICARIFETPQMLSYHMSVEHSEYKRPPTGIS